MRNRVFVSYRRDDAAAEAQLITKALRSAVGDDFVFMADTGDLYVLTYFETGEEKQKVLVKQLWEQAKAQMDGVGH